MIHLLLHFAVPLLVALAFYRSVWRYSWLVLVSTMLVDVDHLLAVPIYDPSRCSIGFHPLHTTLPIVVYVILFALPLIISRQRPELSKKPVVRMLHLIGLGLVIHMVLDWTDCVL